MKVALTNSNKFAITDFKPKHKLNLMTNGYVRIENDNRDYLHRLVMGNPKGVVHHINGNKLDNRKKNLKVYPSNGEHHKHEHEVWNKGIKYDKPLCMELSKRNRGNSLGFYGGHYKYKSTLKETGKIFQAQIRYNGRSRSLGYFEDPLSCQIVYDLVWNEIYNKKENG